MHEYPVFTPQDIEFMQKAVELAYKGQFTTPPNPAVGCVLAKDGKIVGTGFHRRVGEPHAEVIALGEAGENAKGATAYVTLEPCAHFGRTPPCAKALIETGISRVVAAMRDPNPLVAGKGIKMLQDAGIAVAVGLLGKEAQRINKGFFKRMKTGMPYVQLKMAMSIDGKTAMASGESQWITNEMSRQDVQVERARASAILSTSRTVLADNPLLSVRWSQLLQYVKETYAEADIRQPVRIILDSQHQVRPDRRLFSIPSPVWLVGTTPRDMSGFPDFVQSLELQLEPNQTLLQSLMAELGRREINNLWVEAGATLAGSLIEQKLADELVIYMAPKLLGSDARNLCNLPDIQRLSEAPQWHLQHSVVLRDDIKLVYLAGERK